MKIKKYRRFFKNILVLSKVTISLPVTLTAFTGYILSDNDISIKLLYACAGVFLLSSGSSALNHFQDRNNDALMERTRTRPIPSGAVSIREVLIITSLLLLSGALLLLLAGWLPLVLGLLAVGWYNGIYTPLKKVTSMAAVPGAFIGALPPFIGYTAAQGNLGNPAIWVAALFFFIAQIPHFWLLAIYHASDYEKTSLPVITQKFSFSGLRRITFTWLVSAALIGIILPLFDIIADPVLALINIVLSVLMILSAVRLFRSGAVKKIYRQIFMHFNFYVLGVILLILLQWLFY